MKKQFFYAMLAGAAMLASCSSDNVAENGGVNAPSHGDGYISINLNLPSVPGTSTRADNDKYDDGLPAEYAIKTAALVLFEGTTTSNATFKQTVDLYPSLENELDADNDNITSSHRAVAKVNAIESGKKLFGLVLLNYTGLFDGATTFTTSSGTFVMSAGTTTFANLQDQVAGDLTTFISASTGFFMTNAILSTASATSAVAPDASNLQLLVDLSSSTYPTEAEARSHPSGSIYVERGVAKATLSVKSGVTQIESTNPLTIGTVTWAINNTEPTSYIVRKADESSLAYLSPAFSSTYYRFVGNVQMGTTTLQPAEALYRTYWCIDPQYSSAATLTLGASTFKETGTSNPQYCNENTFNVTNQTYQNTTRAVVKVTTSGNTTFYTDNGVNENCTKATIETRIMQVYLNDMTFVNAIKTASGVGSLALTKDMFTVNWTTKNTTTGAITVDNVTMNDAATGWSTLDASQKAAVAAAISSNQATAKTSANYLHKVLEYTDGVVYYEARFQHFADPTSPGYTSGTFTIGTDTDLAPWNKWEDGSTGKEKPTAAVAYPGADEAAKAPKYLGRWGMVRNNWYDVEISAFKKIGLPVDPSTTITNPTTPDDNINEDHYLSVKINVLSWAKRTQSWTF